MPSEHRPFSEWIVDHARGTVDDELTAAMAEVVEAVAHHGKAGSVKLTIKVDAAGSGGRTVTTSCHVEAKPPKAGAEQSIFYVGDGGTLHRDDPFQTRLDLRRPGDKPAATLPDLTDTTED